VLADLKEAKEKCPQKIAALQEKIKKLEELSEHSAEWAQLTYRLFKACEARRAGDWRATCDWEKGRWHEAMDKYAEIRRDLAAQKAALEEVTQACNDLDSRINKLDSEIHHDISPQISRLELDIAKLSTEISELESKIKEIEEKYKDCIEEYERAVKKEKRAAAAKQRAEKAAEGAEDEVIKLEREYKKKKERFPGGVLPKTPEECRNKLEEIKRKIKDGYDERDEEKIKNAEGEANKLPKKVEDEQTKLRDYAGANICLEQCEIAHKLWKEYLENRSSRCSNSSSFEEAKNKLDELKACCKQTRQYLESGEPETAKKFCSNCWRELWRAFRDALREACSDSAREALRNLPGITVEDELGEEAVREILKNMGLQTLEILGELTSGLAKTLRAIETVSKQQMYACCALKALQSAINTDNDFARAGYLAEFLYYMYQAGAISIAGPNTLGLAALEAADALSGLSSEERRRISEAIQKVLRSPRCADIRCP